MKKFLVVLSMVTCMFGMTACGSEVQYTSQEEAKISEAENYAKYYVVPYFLNNAVDYDADALAKNYTNDEIADQYASYVAGVENAIGNRFSLDDIKMEAMMQGYDDVDAYIDVVASDMATNNGVSVEEAKNYLLSLIATYDATDSEGVTTGSVIKSGLASISTGLEITGAIKENQLGEPSSKIDDDTIIVTIPVVDAKKDAEIEVIVSNDKFLELQSIALNVKYSFGETMAKAGENTLVGIGTVFVMLVLISFIISLFAYIPKIQEAFTKKESPKAEAIEKTVAQIAEKEEAAASEDLTDDLELVAVIAAAIAAYEGQASTEGFVVRSIRKVNRR